MVYEKYQSAFNETHFTFVIFLKSDFYIFQCLKVMITSQLEIDEFFF
jgi:hypothetical protein